MGETAKVAAKLATSAAKVDGNVALNGQESIDSYQARERATELLFGRDGKGRREAHNERNESRWQQSFDRTGAWKQIGAEKQILKQKRSKNRVEMTLAKGRKAPKNDGICRKIVK